MTARIKATHVARETRNLGYEPASYRTLYNAILSSRVPADQLDGHRWSIARDDLPKVIEALGLRQLQPIAA